MTVSSAPAHVPAPDGGKTASDESFPVAWLLAPRQRPAVRAYYAFARRADDIADSALLRPEEKLRRLDALDQALRSGQGPSQGTRLREVLAERDLPVSLALDLLEAFRADARGEGVADWPALMAYCDHSAVPVGRFLLALHAEDAAARAPADALCRALQVLNHVQDCGSDWARLGRCYLPGDWRCEAGCGPDDLRADACGPALRRVLNQALAAVDGLLAEAGALPGRLRSRSLRAQAAATITLARGLRRRLSTADPIATRVRPTRLDWLRGLGAGLVAGGRP